MRISAVRLDDDNNRACWFGCSLNALELADTITATFPAILVISTLYSLFGVKDVDKRPE